MATQIPEYKSNSATDIFANYKKVSMHERSVAVFGTSAGAETLATCTPVGFNASTGYYGAWVAPDPASVVIDIDGSTGGNWYITVGGISTGNFAHNATAALVKATLLGMGYDASVKLAAGVYTITFDAPAQLAAVPALAGNVAALTGGTAPKATVDAGASTYGLSSVLGFVWPDPVTLSATNEVQGVIMIKGRIALSDITATVASGDVAALTAELKANALARGIIVEDLVNIH